jgi:FMN phosphatase YigB (HAD superfamily)
MKYNTILFDFGDTLNFPHPTEHWKVYDWVLHLIKKLYNSSYRLGIISNTSRYQDGFWVRNKLAEHNILQYFEMVISSATYAVHKPDMRIFQKAIDFMQLDPTKCIMVGDSEHCDGGCRYFQMTYLKVMPSTNWEQNLMDLLQDSLPKTRKLTHVSEFRLQNNVLITKVKHLSEVLEVGDSLMAGGIEYKVLDVPKKYIRDDIFNKDYFIEFNVEKV